MSRNYINGRAAEYRAIRILEAAGYVANRTAGSHGIYDVVAFNGQAFRLIQVKRGAAAMSPQEREAFKELQVPPGTTKEQWRFVQRGKPPLIQVI